MSFFTPREVRVFGGGEFNLSGTKPKTVAELRELLRLIDDELSGWGDDTKIFELRAHDDRLVVTLSKGITQ